jgi:hypothetical protein
LASCNFPDAGDYRAPYGFRRCVFKSNKTIIAVDVSVSAGTQPEEALIRAAWLIRINKAGFVVKANVLGRGFSFYKTAQGPGRSKLSNCNWHEGSKKSAHFHA